MCLLVAVFLLYTFNVSLFSSPTFAEALFDLDVQCGSEELRSLNSSLPA